MKKQRILLIVRRLRTGGIEKATLNLAQGLLAAGHHVHLLLLKGKSELPLPDGLQLHQYDMDKKVRSRFSGFLLDFLGRVFLRYLIPGSGFIWRGYLNSREMNHFITDFENKHGSLDLILLRGQGVFEILWNFQHQNLWQVVEGPPTSFNQYRLAGWYYRKLYQNKQVVTVSAGIWDVLREQLDKYMIRVARQVVIHNALPIEDIRAQAHAEVADLPEGPFLLHVARLTPVKNQTLLLEAYASSGLTLPLVILGQGGEETKLRQLATSLNITDRVIFLGLKRNPYAYMARAVAFVLSSRQEGLGLVLIESLACGTQAVATDVPGGIREVLIEEQQRLLAENSIEGLAFKLREAVDSPVVVKPEWAERFDSRHIIPQYLHLADVNASVTEIQR